MLNSVIEWLISHTLEAILSGTIIAFIGIGVIVKIRKNSVQLKKNILNNQSAARDIKNATVKGNGNNINIR
ncbi:hypothetical protein [Janthinobacterium sp. 67]|uniref:hypothetical protein n=1 Tax=Janthinobacterium sp. 67 TaxID=2035207 RepID=UPI0012FD8041|nr:hypothetical protein [Janthinobacterium sp. 67]